MVRPKQRKTIEELYGNKSDAPKSQVTTGTNGNSKNGRLTERDYGYIITSNTPYSNGGPAQPPSSANNMATTRTISNVRKETTIRKSARPLMKTSGDKNAQEKDTFNMTDAKKEHNMKINTSRVEASGNGDGKYPYSVSGNKSYVKYSDRRHEAGDSLPQHQHHPHYQHHHNYHNNHYRNVQHDDDEDKDDDTEEFFQLIRQTVESAIGKSISELLNRNFRDLSTKIDGFSAELKNTNALLNKIQTDMNNKIVHYGEENSRHFRYLCMKSEYDKMFYQHQTMIASAPVPVPVTVTANPQKPEKRESSTKINIPKQQHKDSDESSLPAPCSCRSNSSKTSPSPEIKEPYKVSSGEISQKSSESALQAIIQHLNKFSKQMNMDYIRCDQPGFSGGNHKFGTLNNDELMNIDKEILANHDDDISDSSSDDETPRSDDHRHKYGAMTRRTSGRVINNCGGGGDS